MKLSRRRMLSASAGALVTTAVVAHAQTGGTPQPRRPGAGGTDPGPRNLSRDQQNPDIIVPPATDHGTLPNLRFSFSDSHVRMETGGWTRQVTVRELPVSTTIAGVNMRLNAGGIRELHWHKAAEWAFMLYGSARITAIDAEGPELRRRRWRRRSVVSSRRACRTRSRGSVRTAASSCWCSTMASSTKTTRS